MYCEAIGAPVAGSLAGSAASCFRSGVVDSAYRRAITKSKAQPLEPCPRFRGPWFKDRDPASMSKSPRDPHARRGL